MKFFFVAIALAAMPAHAEKWMEIGSDATATYYVDSDSLSRNDEIVSLTKKAVCRVSLWPVKLQEHAPPRTLDGDVQSVRRTHLVFRKDEARLGKCRARHQWRADSRIRLR